ncbi:hypothetical protein PVAND_012603 [Polypedilum vanderplanki]|uniref:Uncharacterized protein n=1 Tax=Polypedilum vanderplanki TaxID=319348 RepID=A0A9J6CMX4_POLVA|nr:hypothetical protein PVAND_012603 [Polypedilum vanderplanki]
MPIKTQELVEAIQVVANDHNIRVTVKSSFKASAVVGASTFVGAIFLGPLGIPIGATAGGLYAYCKAENFKPLAVVIRDEMTDEQRERLCEHVVEAFREFRSEDVVELAVLLPMLLNPTHQFQTIALKKIVDFVTNEMRMHIID